MPLLAAVADTAPTAQPDQIRSLGKTIAAARPQLLPGAALAAVLPPDQQVLRGWAWRQRTPVGWTRADSVAAVPAAWRPAGRVLLHPWDDAVRVSRAVERGHRILRPHVAVHRTLTTGMLAVLAVWHTHRVYTRGVKKGKSPLHLSGMTDAPADWLVALGYPPADAPPMQPVQPEARALALAA